MHLHSQCQFHLCHWLAFVLHCRPLLPQGCMHHIKPYDGGAILPLFCLPLATDNRSSSTNDICTYACNRQTSKICAAKIWKVWRACCISGKPDKKHDKQLKVQLLWYCSCSGFVRTDRYFLLFYFYTLTLT